MRVLTAAHGDELTPLPRGDFKLRLGDRLVIFGPSTELRALLPAKGQKRKKRLTETPS